MSTRLKLWQVDPSWHCPIVGTCLTPAEARAAASKAGHDTDGIEDFRVHHACVHVAADRSRALARALHKRLEAKHARSVRAFARARDVDALAALWDEHRERGTIGGAPWALATHAALDEDLRERVYGEVHMLQHACGLDAAGARRADARRDARAEALEGRLVEERAEAAARLEAERGRAAELERRLVERRRGPGRARAGPRAPRGCRAVPDRPGQPRGDAPCQARVPERGEADDLPRARQHRELRERAGVARRSAPRGSGRAPVERAKACPRRGFGLG